MRVKIVLGACALVLLGLLAWEFKQIIGFLLGATTIFALAAAQAWDIKQTKERVK